MNLICLDDSTLKIKEESEDRMRLNLLSGELLVSDNVVLDERSLNFWRHVKNNVCMLPAMYHKKVKLDRAKHLLKNGDEETPDPLAYLSELEYYYQTYYPNVAWTSTSGTTNNYKINYNYSGTENLNTTWNSSSTSTGMLHSVYTTRTQDVYDITPILNREYYFTKELLISESMRMISFPDDEKVILAIDGSNLHIRSNMKKPWSIFNGVIINYFDLKNVFDERRFKSI